MTVAEPMEVNGDAPGTPAAQKLVSMGDAKTPPLEGLSQSAEKFNLDAFNRRRGGGGGLFGRKKADDASGAKLTTDTMLVYQGDEIPTSLLKHTSGDNTTRAVKMFASVLQYMGVTGQQLGTVAELELAQKLLHQGLKRPELRDELFVQLVKQTRGCPTHKAKLKAWQLFFITAASMPPSKDFMAITSEYVHGVVNNHDEDADIKEWAAKTWGALKRTSKAGQRRTLPDMQEIDNTFKGVKQTAIVFFLDQTFEELVYDGATTVAEALEQIAGRIHLLNYQTFTLFAQQRGGQYDDELSDGEQHIMLEDNKYIADVMFEFKALKKEGVTAKLLVKKRMFRETDEAITEPQFVNLSYIQAQHDFVRGQYPVVREDAAQMVALQIHAEHGASLDAGLPFEQAIEKFMVKSMMNSRPREEWVRDVTSRYKALRQFSKDDAKLQFLRVIRSLPYGNAVFFSVKRIEDPIGLLPAKMILGINKRGVHFFRPQPKEYLHSAELRDLMQFGSSEKAVFFKMRVAGVLHIFQFESEQGEEICMALQTHINDIMMKRYAKANAAGGDAAADEDAGPAEGSLGPKYQAHVAELQRQLDEALDELESMERKMAQLAEERAELGDQVAAQEGTLDTTGLDIEEIDLSALTVADGSGVDPAVLATITAQIKAAQGGHAAALAKLRRTEEAHAAAVERMQAELDEARGPGLKDVLRSKDAKINELIEDLGNKELLLSEAQAQAAKVSPDMMKKLAELEEFQKDVQRREKAQADVIAQQAKRLEELERLYKEEVVNRKKMFNAIEDMKGKIRVYCRVRPILDFEIQRGQTLAVEVPDELTIYLLFKDKPKKEFTFDQVFPMGTDQEKVFANTKYLIQSVIDGYNVCIFAYGQTGSGKTFTMTGNEQAPGLTMRGVKELFRIIDKESGKWSFTVHLSMLELYCDDLIDLLAKREDGKKLMKQPRLEIKKDAASGRVTVPGSTVVPVRSAAQLLSVVDEGQKLRNVASTQMNRESSRSHLIISIMVESVNQQTQAVARGKLSFVDLAGSERVKKSGAAGQQMAEAQAINKSLSALGNVISSLSSESGHIPYRDHKLTMLMSDSIGGTAKTLMFVNLSPVDSNLDETSNSLQYATRVSVIRNEIKKDADTDAQIIQLKKKIEYWKEQCGIPVSKRDYVDLIDIDNVRQVSDTSALING